MRKLHFFQADELLQHKQNGDGAYLVRWSKKKKSFVLSIKYMSEAHADWATTHYNVMRTDQENNRVNMKKIKNVAQNELFRASSILSPISCFTRWRTF